jgi:hypothetical protein
MFYERQTTMFTAYRRLLKNHLETFMIGALFLVVLGFSAWLPYFFAQAALAGGGLTP